MKTQLRIACICCGALAAGLWISACRTKPTAVKADNPAGVYTLVSVDGKPLPASISHGGTVEVRSGTFTINAEGTCRSKMVYVPPSGSEAMREVDATYTRDGSKLTMRWKGAGTTVGTVQGATFTMENEGMMFVYKK